MRLVFLLIFFISAPVLLLAQNPGVKGIVADTAANVSLEKASVSVLRPGDSILVKFSWTSENGAFSITGLPKGEYVLLVSYPGYVDYTETFRLDSATRSFGTLNLITRSRLLAEVLVQGKATAIVMKGDTTEFHKGSFVVQPNSKVEDLLKQLPGISVDNNGTITAHGVTVSKVLVDGEEFFSDDPTFVTRNIRGDMVEKIQLYDKKSEQAAFTGVDDGVKIKTLNVVLREDSKNGYFGKLKSGGGSGQVYNGQAMVNAFKASKRLSIYGSLANNSGGDLGSDGGRFGVGQASAIESGYNGQGLPTARNAGVHYDSNWNKGKQSINADFKISSLDLEGANESLNQQNLLSKTITRSSASTTASSSAGKQLSARFNSQLDSTSSLRVSLYLNQQNRRSGLGEQASARENESTRLYENTRNTSDESEEQSVSSNMLWNKRLRKKGRSLSLFIDQRYSASDRNGFLHSVNQLYDASGNVKDMQRVDQLKTYDNDISAYGSNLNYNEPLSSKLTLSGSYGISIYQSAKAQESFNQSPGGAYNARDAEFSNDFDFYEYKNSMGTSMSYRDKKITASWGSSARLITRRQVDNLSGKTYWQRFVNLNPNTSLSWSISKTKGFRLDYSGSTSQPSIEQLQPVKSNNDPLNIREGNPDLRTYFSNHASLSYESYKTISGNSFAVEIDVNVNPNPIVGSITTDTSGVRVSRSVNFKGRSNSNFRFDVSGGKLFAFGRLSTSLSASTQTELGFENDRANIERNNYYDLGINLSQSANERYDYFISVTPSYSRSRSSLQPSRNISRWSASYSGSFTLYLPGKTEVHANGRYAYTQAVGPFRSPVNPVIVNASASKRFTRSESLKLTLSGNDILNQNTGFYADGFSQSNSRRIRRYFMASLSWDFKRMGLTGKSN